MNAPDEELDEVQAAAEEAEREEYWREQIAEHASMQVRDDRDLTFLLKRSIQVAQQAK